MASYKFRGVTSIINDTGGAQVYLVTAVVLILPVIWIYFSLFGYWGDSSVTEAKLINRYTKYDDEYCKKKKLKGTTSKPCLHLEIEYEVDNVKYKNFMIGANINHWPFNNELVPGSRFHIRYQNSDPEKWKPLLDIDLEDSIEKFRELPVFKKPIVQLSPVLFPESTDPTMKNRFGYLPILISEEFTKNIIKHSFVSQKLELEPKLLDALALEDSYNSILYKWFCSKIKVTLPDKLQINWSLFDNRRRPYRPWEDGNTKVRDYLTVVPENIPGEKLMLEFSCLSNAQSIYLIYQIHTHVPNGSVPVELYPSDVTSIKIAHKDLLKLYIKLAEQGNPQEQYDLANRYLKGQFMTKNEKEAAYWFRKAAEQNHLDAQVKLATLYIKGIGVPKNYNQAAKWLRKTADQNHTQSQYALGILYSQGQGVRKSDDEAFKWIYKAAHKNHTDAQAKLAALYLRGEGVDKSYPEAEKWLMKAAEQGHFLSQYVLGEMYLNGVAVTKDHVKSYLYLSLSNDNNYKLAKTKLNHLISLMSSQELEEGEERLKNWIQNH